MTEPKTKPRYKDTHKRIKEIKEKIEEFEFIKNGLGRINGASVEVRNLRLRGEKVIVDIYLIFEDRTEKFLDEEYDLNLLEARE